MSTFDPEAFLNTPTNSAGETKITVVNPGDYSDGELGDPKVRTFNNKDGGISYVMEISVTFDIDDDQKESLGIKEGRARWSAFLNLDDAFNLEWGPNKNTRLANLREALGQNEDGETWSPAMLSAARIPHFMVEHDHFKDSTYANVSRVSGVE